MKIYTVVSIFEIRGRGFCVFPDPLMPDTIKIGDSLRHETQDYCWQVVGIERGSTTKPFSILVRSDNGRYPEVGDRIFLSKF